ncbi:F0F1 ATP synthase subunit B [Trichococcus ilyis]|jgi:F-type H+-transporting ATPase subunit b|uniref:ATP synthase subunit b n=1 Tax=Trichococcus ilyis TaxID=640938 RepID=A0A143YWS6_9LACT|nr:F0F1 ATP synthase subunit B [Trichococcus ilyis]CZR00568.1 atpase f0 complex subunit b/b' bacterial/chloroplast [Trichococcus ilyis]SEJ38105.1 F-type H+-transporting ATPase subunit b [Trichococcus ilyis]
MTANLVLGEITALGDTIVTLLSFLILMALIKQFAWQPLMKVLTDREEMIHANIDKAATARENAEKKQAEVDAQLIEVRTAASDILNRAQAEGNEIQQNIIKEAKEDALRIKQVTQKELELERKQALESLRAEIGVISVDIAEKILGKEITQADQQSLIEAFIEGLDD